jgi:hypothetical protein
MIDLDYAQRVDNPLPPRLRAELRWVAACSNRCEYAKAYARADYLRAGGHAEDLDDLSSRLGTLPEPERLAVQFVRQLVESAYTVSDSQVARLVELYGDKQVVAIVLTVAYSCFQDRLLLAMGVSVEPDGPLPPVKVQLPKPPPRKTTGKKKDAPSAKNDKKPKRTLTPPATNPPTLPLKLDDPEWTAFSFDDLRGRLTHQVARRKARVPIPDSETVVKSLPEGQRPEKPIRIVWSLVTSGYQPRLSAAWGAGLRAFREESDLDHVFHESMFWIVTRSLQCFY